ncbi:Endonuclease III (EC 4.2.99.18) [Candidatus Synechococcus spongiarum]|uniref:Endonuclease III n=2 Tax=Candidatus Synechococcus spongiarum TaxID=431041 RepID=A0A171DGT2_9SYNE|nr:Endonuclease III (EC 4.2.99.18) [Candidatus Synechococcus spongiarum]
MMPNVDNRGWPPPPQRAALIFQHLGQLYPDARCSLDWRNPFQLLVATMLSAQCTDQRVNQVTPALFDRFPDAASFAAAEPEQVEPYVRPTGFYRNKARHIVSTSRLLLERHQGRVPKSMEALLECPGVARKTANVVLATAYGLNAGVTVDTHVRRLSNRLGLVAATDPARIEVELMALLPQADWDLLSIRLIFHGRAVCKARRPACGCCHLADLCPSHRPEPMDTRPQRVSPLTRI